MLTPGVVVNLALGLVWSFGAIVQFKMTANGLAYPHGNVFTAIMAIAGIAFFSLAAVALRIARADKR